MDSVPLGEIPMYKIVEIFRSVQGEGDDVGRQAVFVRFAGCNYNCHFCDTQHEVHNFILEPKQVVERVRQLDPDGQCVVVLTGGEPLLQVDERLIDEFLGPYKEEEIFEKFRICVETNGDLKTQNLSPAKNLDLMLSRLEVTVSPKTNLCGATILKNAVAVKIICPLHLSKPDVKNIVNCAEQAQFILQPKTVNNEDEYQENCRIAVMLAAEFTKALDVEWRVIPQTHVFMGLQ
jgi:organic radical activating enzyme